MTEETGQEHITRLYIAQGGKCFYCNCDLNVAPHKSTDGDESHKQWRHWTRDHIVPKKGGGRWTVLSCNPCNQSKADRLPTQQEIIRFYWVRKTLGYEAPLSILVGRP